MDFGTVVWHDRLEHAFRTDIGMRVANNQDSFTVQIAESESDWQRRGDLFIVADGMGACAAGELASRLAIECVPWHYDREVAAHTPPRAILAAFRAANIEIHRRGQTNADFHGMGTTCTAMILHPKGALVAHVGDTRAYRLRGVRFERLTFDHSLSSEIQAAAAISPETAGSVPKNILTRALGHRPSVQVDLEGPLSIMPDDTFLLCTDGLSGQVREEEMGGILACLPPAEAVQILVDLANLRGGPDNITVIVTRAVGSVWTGATLPSRTGATSFLRAASRRLAELAKRAANPRALTLRAVTGWFSGKVGTGARNKERPHRQLGRGPYGSTDCSPNAVFAQELAVIVRELREAALEAGWRVDWNHLDMFFDAATSANGVGNSSEAVRQYSHAISFMMAELRQSRWQ
jgi:protein phosphatase